MAEVALEENERRALLRQLTVSRLLSPLWVPLFTLGMRFGARWDVEGIAGLRAEYAKIRGGSKAPLLICANHLTMYDSLVIAWALGGPGFYLANFDAIPWNTPEKANFASTWWKRVLAYVVKCVPVERGSDRKAVARVLDKVRFLMERGEVGLIFPEGGRSRTGRVEMDNAAYGVGRLVSAMPGCQVLCVYMRGKGQESWSETPKSGETFRLRTALFEPKTDARGLRGSLDISKQIIGRLIDMEQAWFRDRE